MNKENLPTPPPVEKRSDEPIHTEKRRYSLITYLYGGGVEAGKADPVTIVRGTEIRGLLRFWWRAARGGESRGDLNRLRQREEEIWGSAAQAGKPGPSSVNIRLQHIKRGRQIKNVKTRGGESVHISDPKSPFGYVAFPLQPDDGGPVKSVRSHVRFTLVISYPEEYAVDVRAALWAWETFGGIGARTRRGFGAVHCLQLSGQRRSLPQSSNIEEEIRKGLQKHVSQGQWPEGVPHLHPNLEFKVSSVRKGKTPTIEAWKYLIGRLKHFRQARYGTGGLSKWPEANEIRRRFGKPLNLQNDLKEEDVPQKFPRAAFGLPIVFHLQNDGGLKNKSLELIGADDPRDNRSFNRFASRLMFRPIACKKREAVGLAIIMEGPEVPPQGLKLRNGPGEEPVEWKLTPSEAKMIPPLKSQNNNTDVLDAFLNTL